MKMEYDDLKQIRLAVVYQSAAPPARDGILKPMKPGGYSDSGADIAFQLREAGITIVTPNPAPDTFTDMDWVFPDTFEGISHAVGLGANCIWLNTVLFDPHPILKWSGRGLLVVGQRPDLVDKFDDKLLTNNILSENGLPVPKNWTVGAGQAGIYKDLVTFPVVAKPIRGRGSQGVSLIDNLAEYDQVVPEMLSGEEYGTSIYLERYLNGEEVTVTVMPGGQYQIAGKMIRKATPWCLPAVRRFNHHNGIAPYNGIVAVVENSEVVTAAMESEPKFQKMYEDCALAGKLVSLQAPIRIDCRSDESGNYFLFDLNMKPNMTGPSRPHRQNQDSLSMLAARGIGWSFGDLLLNILRQAWKV